MAGQHIGFCRAADGVRIAFAVMGSGPPLVYVAGWPGHLEMEMEAPFAARFLEELAYGHTLIRYDMRGTGLSDRNAADLSFDGFLSDLSAVVDHLQLKAVALLSLGDLAGPLAIAYAAAHPQRVTHLVLSSGFAHGEDLAPPAQQEILAAFVANFGWPIFSFIDTPEIDAETHRAVREIQEQGASHAVQSTVLRLMYGADVRALVPKVKSPALVLHAINEPVVPFEAGRELAIQLPGSRFVPYSSASAAPWANSRFILREVRQFLQPDLPERREAVPVESLSAREREVLGLLALGYTSRQIADELTLSTRTVERHVSNIYAKAGVHSRAAAVAYAIRNGGAPWVVPARAGPKIYSVPPMSRPLPRTTVHPNHTRITPARHSVRGDRVKRLLLCGAIFSALLPGAALAHSGGHQGGCQDFGHINGYIAQDAEAVGDSLGIAGARNLGDIVSTFAHIPDGRGVGDIVEDVDHAACGTN